MLKELTQLSHKVPNGSLPEQRPFMVAPDLHTKLLEKQTINLHFDVKSVFHCKEQKIKCTKYPTLGIKQHCAEVKPEADIAMDHMVVLPWSIDLYICHSHIQSISPDTPGVAR